MVLNSGRMKQEIDMPGRVLRNKYFLLFVARSVWFSCSVLGCQRRYLKSPNETVLIRVSIFFKNIVGARLVGLRLARPAKPAIILSERQYHVRY